MANAGANRGGKHWSAIRFTQVQKELRRRARRLNHFRVELLSEPAWDILLHVYSFELVQHTATASELVERVNVPSTTAIRWIKVLETEGLVDRTIVAADPTQVIVALTVKGAEALDSYFSEAAIAES